MSDRLIVDLCRAAVLLWQAWRQHRHPSKWARMPAKRVRW